MCRPLAGNENSCHTLEKPLVPRVGKQSPRLKILENSWGGGGIKNPPEQKILGMGVQIKESSMEGV